MAFTILSGLRASIAAMLAAETHIILNAITTLQTEIRLMSTTISGQIDADTASLQADLASLTSGVTLLETELSAALAGVTPGTTITQAQVDALTAVHTSFAALAASIPPAPAAPAAPVPPVTTPPVTTPAGA